VERGWKLNIILFTWKSLLKVLIFFSKFLLNSLNRIDDWFKSFMALLTCPPKFRLLDRWKREEISIYLKLLGNLYFENLIFFSKLLFKCLNRIEDCFQLFSDSQTSVPKFRLLDRWKRDEISIYINIRKNLYLRFSKKNSHCTLIVWTELKADFNSSQTLKKVYQNSDCWIGGNWMKFQFN